MTLSDVQPEVWGDLREAQIDACSLQLVRRTTQTVVFYQHDQCIRWRRNGTFNHSIWELACWLAKQNAPVASPVRLFHCSTGNVVEIWQRIDRDPPKDRCRIAASLRELHTIAAQYERSEQLTQQDSFDRVLARVERIEQLMQQDPASAQALGLDAPTMVSRINSICERVPSTPVGSPLQVLHGDPHCEHARCAQDGSIRWIDFDTAMVGPRAYDLAKLMWDCPAEQKTSVLAAYGADATDRKLLPIIHRRIIVPTWLWQLEMALLHPHDPIWRQGKAQALAQLAVAEQQWS